MLLGNNPVSENSAKIRNLWKVGRVIPLHKPGKPIDKSKSFTAIALLSPNAKLTEKLLPRDFIGYPLKEHQHGIRNEHSTTTALKSVTNKKQKGLDQKKPCCRTLLAALDLTTVFDTVDDSLLLRDIIEAPLPNSTKDGSLHTYMIGFLT